MNDWYFYFNKWINQVHTGYVLLTPLLILLFRLRKQRATLFYHLLLASNTLLLVTASCHILIGILVFFRLRFFPLEPPSGDGNFVYVLMLVAFLLLPMLFWWPRCRNSYRISLLVLLIMLSAVVAERIATVRGTLSGRQLPSEIGYYLPDGIALLITLLSYSVVTAIISLFIRQKSFPAT